MLLHELENKTQPGIWAHCEPLSRFKGPWGQIRLETDNKDRIANSRGKEIKHYEKRIILKGNITTIYIEHKHKNTRTSVLIHPQNAGKQYH